MSQHLSATPVVLLAPDKFKGSLTASQVADALAAGLADAGVRSTSLPAADGGDGSVAAAVAAGFRAHPILARRADGTRGSAEIAYDGHTAVVEIANTCGLQTLPPGVLNPMTSSSRGLGEGIRAAVHLGARRIVLALGGSASTDGGAGMLAALGVRFTDRNGQPIEPCGATLGAITGVDTSNCIDLSGIELIVATDVDNPLLHQTGAAAVFGPQKGAGAQQVQQLETGLDNLAHVLETAGPGLNGTAAALAEAAGAGAAGGVGFACLWLGARRVPGADFFLDLLGYQDRITGCTAVITGEGRLDHQSLNGKLPFVVVSRSRGVPVHLVVGRNDLPAHDLERLGVDSITAICELANQDTSRDVAESTRLLRTVGMRLGCRIGGND